MDAFHKDGAVPGFFCYPTDDFTGEERAKNMLDFRDALEEAVLEKAGEDAVTFLGGASGLYCGYLDFIAWDLPAVMDAAREFFEARRHGPISILSAGMYLPYGCITGKRLKRRQRNR